MSPRFALIVVLFAGCDEVDDREAHPIVLSPSAPSEERKSTGEEVSPLTPIVLPKEATPPPMKAGPPPPPPAPLEPVEAKSTDAGQAEAVMPPAIAEEKPVIPPPQKPAPPKTKRKKKR